MPEDGLVQFLFLPDHYNGIAWEVSRNKQWRVYFLVLLNSDHKDLGLILRLF